MIKKIILIALTITLFGVPITYYSIFKSDLKEIKNQGSYKDLSEMPPLLTSAYRGVIDDDQINLNALRVLREPPQRMLYYHLNNWFRLQFIKFISKDEKLEFILNKAYLGEKNNVPVYGYFQASLSYFCKPIEALNYIELSQLIALEVSPSRYQKDETAWNDKRNENLELFEKNGVISKEEHEKYQKAPLAETCE